MTHASLLLLWLQVAAPPPTAQAEDWEDPAKPQPRAVAAPAPASSPRVVAPPPVASIAPASVEMPRPLEKGALEDMLVRSEDQMPVTALLDELLDELVHQLGREDARALSPMAVRWIKISPNLRADLAQSLETRLSARLVKGTEIAQVVCTDCRALHSRIEGREWVVSLGAVHQADVRRAAEDIGARTFLDLDVQYISGAQPSLTLAARAFRAADARVVFASAIRADETTASILRTGQKPPSREEQVAELGRKLDARPYYGIQVALGMAWLPYDGPDGGITGATVSARAFERFGRDRRHMYGIQAEGFLNPNRLQAGILSAIYSWQATAPNLNDPELRLSWGLGAFIASGQSNEGNSVLFESSADYIMKFRFSFGGGVTYLVPTKYSGYDLGGFGIRARFAFNW